MTQAFTADRVEFLKILCSQAAISLQQKKSGKERVYDFRFRVKLWKKNMAGS